jgi:MYXO-CTERM domain-containing protein
MKNLAITLGAIGATAFAATLGQAHASVVGLAVSPSGVPAEVTFISVDSKGTQTSQTSGSPLHGPVSYSSPYSGSATCSQFTPNGSSLSANVVGGYQYEFSGTQSFYATSDVDFSLTGTIGSALGYLTIGLVNADGTLATRILEDLSAGSFNEWGTLAATTNGQFYVFDFYIELEPTVSYSSTLFDLSLTSVPAPGAIALVGFAGLAGRRRR